MSGHLINRTNSNSASRMVQQQSHEGSQSPDPAPAITLDELVDGLVSSNALPPGPPEPPEAPTLYRRLNYRHNVIRRTRRHITNELRRVLRRIAAFQQVPRGRLVVLTLQLGIYRQREADLLARIDAFLNGRGPANVGLETVDSSADEEDMFGQDPAPFLDHGSDDEPELTPYMEAAEAYLRDHRQQRRPEQLRGPGRAPAFDHSLDISGAIGAVNYPILGLQNYSRSARPALEGFTTQNARSDRTGSSTADSSFGDDEEDEEEGAEEEEEDEDEGDGDVEPDFPPEDPLSSHRDRPQSEANENGADPEQPTRWQNFHQHFMYSCRGEVSAVTSKLQEAFQFEPETSQIWVGRQLNRSENIRQQIEYLETYLPGEIGTLERAESRLRMIRCGVFIQDVYDGKSAGQIFDIDPASDAYMEPIRPADLPATWTPLLDATLLTVLPDIPDMEAFWLENAGVLQEIPEDGIGWLRKERALNIRCGQLQYLGLSEEQLAAGSEREQARIESWYGGETEREAVDEGQASA
jgi:hypothetical protein